MRPVGTILRDADQVAMFEATLGAAGTGKATFCSNSGVLSAT